jgi:hypothetical protein
VGAQFGRGVRTDRGRKREDEGNTGFTTEDDDVERALYGTSIHPAAAGTGRPGLTARRDSGGPRAGRVTTTSSK